jgi:amino acid adenylation domain-containing protein
VSLPAYPFLIQHLLQRSASKWPDRVAVRSGTGEITYGQLDILTDSVAATLNSAGVSKGDRVGIYLPKSVASIVSIYSILKSGAAYVPFDPEAPSERLAFIAKDCGIRTLLSCSAKKKGVDDIIAKGAPIRTVVEVDYDSSAATSEPAPSPGVSVISWDEARNQGHPPGPYDSTEVDTAYILYTSGSTGVPKGVMISHRNSLSFVNWAADCVELSHDDTVACHAPLHFDISTFSIFSTCGAGGKVLMIPEKASTFPVDLASLIEREGVTVWYSVPSALVLLALYGNLQKRDLGKLRTIVYAGEVFPVKFLKQLMSLVPKARYLNWYGPTETNVCTSYEVPRLSEASVASIPIGKACSNTEVFAISDEGKVVAHPGENGELYVRGPTVMQGYWGDREKTNRLLVPNPLNPSVDEKVYKTGDLVTLDEEGNYVYLGRRDGMIKTRGYRVELGDIEAAIYSHPGVKEAVVVPVPDEMVGNLLHAFITPNDGATLTREEVRAFCGSKLPRYMVPDTVSFMMSIPKTSSGKMDRVALARSSTQG